MRTRDRCNRDGSVVAKTGLAIGVALAGLSTVLPAQGYDLEPGVKIRVSIYRASSPTPVSRGILLTQTADSLYLVGDHADTVAFSLGPGMKIEAVSGRQGHTWLGVGIGSLVGAFAGCAVERAVDDQVAGCPRGLLVGLPAGALIGALIGSKIKSDRWTVVPRVRPAPGGVGAGIGMTIRF